MSREIIKAESFWSNFAEELKEKFKNDISWKNKYNNNKLWTKFIFEFLWDFASKTYNYSKLRERSTEYLRTDMGFYDIDKTTEDIASKYNEFEWDFDIAIEHENDETAWLDEFVKLVHVNCGLKVLISYYRYYDKNGNITEPEEIIKIAEKIYNTRKYKNLNDNWLIILGPCFDDMEKGKDFIAFKSVIDKEKESIKFEKLEAKKVIHNDSVCINLVRQGIKEPIMITIEKLDYMGAIDFTFTKLADTFGTPDISVDGVQVGWLIKNINNSQEILIINSNKSGKYEECLKWSVLGTFLSKETVSDLESIADSLFYDWMI